MPNDAKRRAFVEELLAQGLDLYGRNRTAEAIGCWREVLRLAPGEERARDYLESAGVDPGPPVRVSKVVRVSVPPSPALSRSARLEQDHLGRTYQRELGELTAVPRVTTALGKGPLHGDHRVVMGLVDGSASFAELLARSPLGAYETARVLLLLVARGEIAAAPASVERPEPAKVPPMRPRLATQPQDEYTLLFNRATEAYLRREHDTALRLFEECVAARPGDRRAQHNLARLKALLAPK